MATPASHVLKPSWARVVTIDSFIAVPRGSEAIAPPPLNWPAKDPCDILDYVIEFSPAVLGNDGDSLATLDVTVTPDAPGDLSMTNSGADGTRAVLWFSGGQAGTVYVVTISINTTNGRTIQRSIILPVILLSAPATPAMAIQTAAGLTITDQNGNPVLSS
ncbi:MAG: hypothetical protein P4L71_08535 [Acetobacteraceae bacterium]|nr:hypothetical protein [Acetobacteraceae bacterium]